MGHLLVVVLDKIHHIGYRDLNDAVVKETVKAEVPFEAYSVYP